MPSASSSKSHGLSTDSPEIRPLARAASNDGRPSDVQLDQYYTRPDVAERLYGILQQHFDPTELLMVEPSAGTGSFYRLLPEGSVAFDIKPKYPGIITADFLSVKIWGDTKIAVIGNPPFGRNSSRAVRFFNHAAGQSSIIALILPRTFRKASIVNRINRAFRLLREEDLPRDAFTFRSKPYDVPAVFQIWERREGSRGLQPVETLHPDFEFTTSDRADFAIPRAARERGDCIGTSARARRRTTSSGVPSKRSWRCSTSAP